MEEGECINWAELPYELTSSILRRLGPIDILENAQRVCTSWRRVCKDPDMWRKIDMRSFGDKEYEIEIIMRNFGYLAYKLQIMFRHAVDRSQGGLVEIDLWNFGTDSLLNYIADSSSNLRSLKLALMPTITIEVLTEALVKLPLLEELEVSNCTLWGDSLKVVGQSCPDLNTLKLHRCGMGPPRDVSDDDALAIAKTMHGLRFLQLVGNSLTDAGLNAILDNCPYLEHLDLRQCLNLNLVGDLEKRCSERIKVLRRPNDSTHDYPYDVCFYDADPPEDYYFILVNDHPRYDSTISGVVFDDIFDYLNL
ncbi:F-box protein SKIP19 [Raphanus sativus]|nr:F-box protein SKIP19 [Raphanus sativus]